MCRHSGGRGRCPAEPPLSSLVRRTLAKYVASEVPLPECAGFRADRRRAHAAQAGRRTVCAGPGAVLHLKSKQELVDEMATSVLTEARRNAAGATGDWPNWAMKLGHRISGANRLTVARRKPALPHPYSHDGEQRDSSDSALVSGSRS